MENNRRMVGTDMDVLPFVVKMRRCITVILIAIDHKMASIVEMEVKTKMMPKGVRREKWMLRRSGVKPGMCIVFFLIMPEMDVCIDMSREANTNLSHPARLQSMSDFVYHAQSIGILLVLPNILGTAKLFHSDMSAFSRFWFDHG